MLLIFGLIDIHKHYIKIYTICTFTQSFFSSAYEGVMGKGALVSRALSSVKAHTEEKYSNKDKESSRWYLRCEHMKAESVDLHMGNQVGDIKRRYPSSKR